MWFLCRILDQQLHLRRERTEMPDAFWQHKIPRVLFRDAVLDDRDDMHSVLEVLVGTKLWYEHNMLLPIQQPAMRHDLLLLAAKPLSHADHHPMLGDQLPGNLQHAGHSSVPALRRVRDQ